MIKNLSNRTVATIFLGALFLAGCDQAPEIEPPIEVIEVESLTDYLTDYQIKVLQNSPERVAYSGVPLEVVGVDLNSKLDDYSPAGDARIREALKVHYATLLTFDRDDLSADEQIYYDIALTLAERDIGRIDGPGYYTIDFLGYAIYPITQLSGAHMDTPRIIQSTHPINSLQDARNYVARLGALAGVLDDSSALLRRDEEMGFILPTFALDKTVAFLEGMVNPPARENPLYTVFVEKLDGTPGLTVEQKTDLTSQALAVLEGEVFPAYQRMIDVFNAQRPRSRDDAGLWAQPGGDALYVKMAAAMGDTDLTPEQIHQLGLAEVSRITRIMDDILISEGYTEGSVGERLLALGTEARFIYPNTEAGKLKLIEDLNAHLNDMKARLPAYFITIPEADVIVKRFPKQSEATAPGGFYDGPSMDGSRPGIFWVNLRDTAETPSWQMPTLTYHETLPGHHFEVAQAVTATDRPLFRRLGAYNSFSEGWALYSENLAEEMGVYEDDPFGNLGRLHGELYRAVRLVVDTGMHYKRWTREQAIDYMAEVTGSARSGVISEIERYAVWPGQALGYKLGMLKFQELRALAEAALGENFDIREFHEVVLGKGPMPMKVVEARVLEWIESQVD
ncbi:MAG: DUF885 domain-containing protein [Sphingomonadales bacterium]